MDTTLFFALLFVHVVSLIVGFGAVLVLDFFGLFWMFKKRTLSQFLGVADISQILVWLGWGGLAASGVPLLFLKGYVDPLIILKIFLVALLGINGLFLHSIKKDARKVGDEEKVPPFLFFRMVLSTGISMLGWWGALAIGFYHSHVEHVVPWPPSPWLWISILGGLLVVAYFAGKLIFGKGARRPAGRSGNGIHRNQ
jgi:hypothetical protein